VNVPVVETARLILRGYSRADFEDYAALWSDPVVMAHMQGSIPKSQDEAWTSFLRTAGHWQILGYGSWAIEEKTSGKYVGGAGFHQHGFDRGEELRGVPGMGWWLLPTAFGKGYGTEAVLAALEWGRNFFGSVRVTALTAPENFASINVARKCGFVEYRRALSLGREMVFFERML